MVWYVPPLSPLIDAVDPGAEAADADDVFHAIDEMRIPVQYLANLLAAGDGDAIRRVLRRLVAVRAYMREEQLGGTPDAELASQVGFDVPTLTDLYRLLAVAKYEDRYVIPPAHTEQAERLANVQTGCSVDYEGQFQESASEYRQASVEFIHLEPKGSAWSSGSDLAGRPPSGTSAAEPR
jgi:nitrate reductase beta subunit